MQSTLPFLLILIPTILLAHSGRTNKSGCHNNNNQAGDYHCHGAKSKSLQIIKTNSKVKIKKISTIYKRKLYPHWIDKDKDCQDQRTEVLIRDSIGKVKFKRQAGFFDPRIADAGRLSIAMSHTKYYELSKLKKPCNVSHGKWIGPFSGKTFTKASNLDIDHIVALKHAHDHGASTWNRKKRREFANDPDNLLAVEGKLNKSKGSQSPLTWMPLNKDYWCTYVKKWVAIKTKYRLIIDDAEKMFINKAKFKYCKD